MLKWKKHVFGSIANNVESLYDLLVGASGKNRVIKYITCDIDSGIFMRVYRDADQIIDFPCDLITSAAPLLPLDCPLDVGQVASVGFGNVSAGTVTPQIAIGYEET